MSDRLLDRYTGRRPADDGEDGFYVKAAGKDEMPVRTEGGNFLGNAVYFEFSLRLVGG